MKNHMKMIDALLLLEQMCWRLASRTESFSQIIGQGLKRFVLGRRGRRLLCHREIYARNIFKYWKADGRAWADRGLYIRRVGRHNSVRGLRVGQD